MKKHLKKIAIGLGLALLVLVAINFGYFWKNLKFTFVKPVAQHQAGVFPISKMKPDTLIIESLDINVQVQYVDEQSEKIFQQALQKGVVHYPKTAMPGEYGNVYIFGHSSDFAFSKGDYKTVFALLPRIEKNAKILLSDGSGNAYTYVVTETFVAAAGDLHLLDQGEYKRKRLTLQTSYPIGTALKRFIVIAEIVEDITSPADPNAS